MKAGAKQVIGYIAVVLGGILGLLLLRAVVFGRIVNFWMLLGDLLFAGLAVYLIYAGRRVVCSAKRQPLRPARFGWGRMLLGAILLFSNASSHFHLYPVRTVIQPMQPSNATEAAAMNITAIAIALGSAALIVSGICKGLRPAATKSASALSMQ